MGSQVSSFCPMNQLVMFCPRITVRFPIRTQRWNVAGVDTSYRTYRRKLWLDVKL